MAGSPDRGAALATINIIELNLYPAAVELFFYGINAVLFCFYIHVRFTGAAVRQHGLLIATTILFILCTLHCSLQISTAILANRTAVEKTYGLAGGGKSFQVSDAFRRAVDTVFVTNNLLADCIFIFRCYAAWNFQGKAIVLPSILLVSSAVLGYWNIVMNLGTGYFLFYLSVGVSSLTNIVLVVLTAGRIWWMARQARKVVARDVIKKYYNISAMIFESGAILCTVSVLYLALTYTEKGSTRVMCAALAQLAGITPTIIAVRIGLGRSVESVGSVRTQAQDSPLEFNAAASINSFGREIQSFRVKTASHMVEVVGSLDDA